jgi:pimeloyl-ACP methyl ester carboxylesterase
MPQELAGPDRPADLILDLSTVPPPDREAEPQGFVVEMSAGERIHFLDWGAPAQLPEPNGPPVLLLHGLAQTAWAWTPVARRLRALRRVVAMDMRGHGLSDAPTHGYEREQLVEDGIAVAEGSGSLESPDDRIVLAGHGSGAMFAAWTAAALGERCAGLVLVDGGWEDLTETTEMDADEFVRSLDEPPEVLRSMTAYLADRAGYDPATWDADQERAARAAVVEVPAGKVVLATRPHVVAATVEGMFSYSPRDVLPAIACPIVALRAADDEFGTHGAALAQIQDLLAEAGGPPIRVAHFPTDGHNLMRYRPAEVTAAILSIGSREAAAPSG